MIPGIGGVSSRFLDRLKGGSGMMPGMRPGMGPMMHHPEIALMEKYWEMLDEQEMKMLILRMIDAKIMMKEARLKQLQHKIETYNMAKQMIEKK